MVRLASDRRADLQGHIRVTSRSVTREPCRRPGAAGVAWLGARPAAEALFRQSGPGPSLPRAAVLSRLSLPRPRSRSRQAGDGP